MEIISELYKFLFVLSLIYLMNVFGNFMIKVYGRFKLREDTRFVLTKNEKLLLWISLAIFITYLI